MPWNQNDYPVSFKNLESDVRKKAIEIANALVREDYSEQRAISIALTKAREAVHGDDEKRDTYTVKPRDEEWVFVKEDGEKAIYAEDTKDELLQKAKPYVNEQNGILKIYKDNGQLEETLYE